MQKKEKRFTIVGNWKMHPDTLEEAKKLFSSISRKASMSRKVNVVLAPPAPFLGILSGRGMKLAAQDVSTEPRGAFTGSVSARELRSAGAEYAIVGHSERRAAGDTDEIVAKKANEAIAAGLRVILCVGEKQRDEHGHYLREVREQLSSALSAISKKGLQWVTIAYEPVWAVNHSFDSVPKPADIHEMSIYIKKVASDAVGKKFGLRIPVLYGGSLDTESAGAILRESAVDGLLVGRHSLDPETFGAIIKHANSRN